MSKPRTRQQIGDLRESVRDRCIWLSGYLNNTQKSHTRTAYARGGILGYRGHVVPLYQVVS